MFYPGLDPYTLKSVYVPKTANEKAEQRALLQYFKPENQDVIIKALIKANRKDLIGFSENCLVKPNNSYRINAAKQSKNTRNNKGKRSNKWQPRRK